MKHTLTISALSFCPIVCAQTASNDSIVASHTLEEVVVVSQNAWIEGNKAIFIPTKQEKNVATDPASLVQRMNIPTLIVEGSVIKNLQGQNVPVFINGEPADNIDISTFWPKQTFRVEYIDHPTDPTYLGVPYALNFVMQEYAVGGVAKVSAFQQIPNKGNYDVSSKLVYKKMTYGALINAGYSRNHSTATSGSDIYNGVYYDSQHHDRITNEYDSHSWIRSNQYNVALNAKYRNGLNYMTHTVGLKWQQNPGSGTESTNSWSPSLFGSDHSAISSTARSLSPSLSGLYTYILNPKLSLSANWQYSYSRNHTYSSDQTGTTPTLLNSSCENVHSASAAITTSYMLRSNMAVWLKLKSNMNWFATQYAGTSDFMNRQWRGDTEVAISYRWMLAGTFFMSIDPGISINYWHIYGNKTESYIRPSIDANINWQISNSLSAGGHVAFFNNAPAASQSGDVLIHQNELTWLASNSRLRNTTTWLPSIYLTWMPMRQLRLSADLSYLRSEDEIISYYTVAPANQGGIVKTFVNSKPTENYALNIIATGRFLNNRLSLTLQPVLSRSITHGIYADTFNWFRMRGTAGYDVGNFHIYAVYSSPQQNISDGGMTRTRYSSFWNFGAQYGNGDIYIDLCVNDIFHNKATNRQSIRSGIFDSTQSTLITGRSVEARLTYTFGYGKKVDRNIEIDAGGEIKSGALIGR